MIFALTITLLVQVGLLALGVWQVQQPTGFTQSVGVFNIIANLIFGGMNVVSIFRG